jgi:hypothetical protein
MTSEKAPIGKREYFLARGNQFWPQERDVVFQKPRKEPEKSPFVAGLKIQVKTIIPQSEFENKETLVFGRVGNEI